MLSEILTCCGAFHLVLSFIRINSGAKLPRLENWNSDQLEFVEEFKILLPNRANKVLGVLDVSDGGIVGTVADPKVVFACALKAAACGIILAHSHPSGNLTASQADIDLTKKLSAGGRILEIAVLDHIIITS